jgi:hypothetical protein
MAMLSARSSTGDRSSLVIKEEALLSVSVMKNLPSAFDFLYNSGEQQQQPASSNLTVRQLINRGPYASDAFVSMRAQRESLRGLHLTCDRAKRLRRIDQRR